MEEVLGDTAAGRGAGSGAADGVSENLTAASIMVINYSRDGFVRVLCRECRGKKKRSF